MQQEFMTPDEVAKSLRISEDSVTRLLRVGKLPGYKIEGSWRVDRKDLAEYLATKRNTQDKK
jgi:excisionase family DNA binding protein